jgi:predicted alpha/beta superfamily hydrolase
MDKMNITSAQYVEIYGQNNTIKIVVDGIEMSVPLDPANRHYAEILRQVADGTLTIEEAD